MEGILLRVIVLFSLLFSTNTFAQVDECIQHTDLKEISQNFSQFKKFVKNKSEYCEQDLGAKWLKIGQSLVVLKNITPDEPAIDSEDAFTYKAISEKDWWSYFTKRAHTFAVETNCPQNVVAYVQPFWGQGVVHLCDLFFDFSASSQASTMMHEVRHFDGHSHVTCTRGNEKGLQGACDGKITGQGSYAISVQTLVGLARSTMTTKDDVPLLESEAVYMAFNKFNIVPQVKLSASIILSNSIGEVYRWVIGKGADLVGTLKNPGLALNSASNLTIYPTDASQDAYRMNNTLTTKVENPGLYAKHYNAETVSEREKYKSISYFGTGGLLKGNTLITLCDRKGANLGVRNLDNIGSFNRIITISDDQNDVERKSYLVSENGDLFAYTCQSNSSKTLNFKNSGLKVSAGSENLLEAFSVSGQDYALMDDGVLLEMSVQGNKITTLPLTMPIANSDWLSATPISKPEVF